MGQGQGQDTSIPRREATPEEVVAIGEAAAAAVTESIARAGTEEGAAAMRELQREAGMREEQYYLEACADARANLAEATKTVSSFEAMGEDNRMLYCLITLIALGVIGFCTHHRNE